MDIRGYEFYKLSGLPISGAAVDVWDAVDGTPGGSPIASTTTTANGRWEFTGLTATPKDVRVTFSGAVEWYKGLGKVSITTLLVGTGGATILGNVGIGAAAVTNSGILLQETLTAIGNVSVGFDVNPTGSSGSTTEITGIYSRPATAASAFTCTQVTDFHALNPTKGAGSTITSAYGLLIDPITTGNTNNYGVYIGAPSGGSGINVALQVQGLTNLGAGATVSGVNGSNTFVVTGDGNTSAHNALLVQNAVGNPLITARNDGLVTVGTSPSNSIVNLGASSSTIAFFGAGGSTRVALGAAATDLTTVVQLANNIRTALQAYGLCN